MFCLTTSSQNRSEISLKVPTSKLISYFKTEPLRWHISEAATEGVLLKKAFSENSQNSQENTCF